MFRANDWCYELRFIVDVDGNLVVILEENIVRGIMIRESEKINMCVCCVRVCVGVGSTFVADEADNGEIFTALSLDFDKKSAASISALFFSSSNLGGSVTRTSSTNFSFPSSPPAGVSMVSQEKLKFRLRSKGL